MQHSFAPTTLSQQKEGNLLRDPCIILFLKIFNPEDAISFFDLFLLFFCFVLFLGEDAQSVMYKSIELCCSQRTKYHHKFKCFQVENTDPNIKLLYL